MGRSRYVGEPTIGGRHHFPPDSQKVDARHRAVAQPLPGKSVEEVKEKAGASVKDKAKALSKHSKSKKTYDESDLNNDDAAPADIDPSPSNPSYLVDAPQEPKVLTKKRLKLTCHSLRRRVMKSRRPRRRMKI